MANSTTLTTGTNSGTQGTTQSPQSAIQPSGFAAGTPSSSVQPNVAGSQLNTGGTSGISLQTTQLSTLSLSSSTTASVKPATVTPHHNSPFLASLAIILFVLAIGMFWYTSHTAKNTTN